MKNYLERKILRINLSNENFIIEPLKRELLEKYIGGRGLGAYFLMKEVPPDTGPLSPENKLIFMNGPLVGSLIPGNNKICVTFKSPLTQSYSYSLCGGHWGPELKYAGFDGLIIEGKARKPAFLSINNEMVEFKSAENIWGNLVPESEYLIQEDLNGNKAAQIAVIGPAGEKLVQYASISHALYRDFGRGGPGAVMGSKNLKGIAIRGSFDIKISNPQELLSLGKELIHNIRNSRGGKIRRQYGTMELVERVNNAGFWVNRNFTEGFFTEGYKLEGSKMREEIVFGDSSCFSCPIACGKRTTLSLKNDNLVMEGPEFETVGMLGPNCGISDWSTILQASKICDDYGFDSINAGACISMLMEAFEANKLTIEDIDGINAYFGNKDALLLLLKKIGERDGIGDVLAEGIKTASNKLKIEELAIHSKGQSFPVYDPRGAKAMALTYATSPKGAHHMYATTFGAELSLGNRFEIKGKALLERDQQISMCIVDSIAMCSTMRAGIPLNDQVKAYRIVTGIDIDAKNLLNAAERIINLERLYNVKIGFTRKDDTIPKRFLETPLSTGESKGQVVDLDTLLDEYYAVMGWDVNGIPTKEKLRELDLLHFN